MKIDPVNNAGILILICVFAILYSVIYRILKQSSLCTSRSVDVAAICVSLLCLMGMCGFFEIPAGPQDYQLVPLADTTNHDRDHSIPFLLILETLLGLLILAMVVLMSFGRLFRNAQSHKHYTEPDQNTQYKEPHSRPDYEQRSEGNSRAGSWEDDRDDNSSSRWVS